MKNNFKRIFGISLLLLSLFTMTFFFSQKKNNVEPQDQAVAYYYETDSSYLYNLLNSSEKLDNHYNLTKHYPLINENQTDSNLCWLYSSMNALESAFMLQTGEYYNFSEVGQAYIEYASLVKNGNSNPTFDKGGVFDTFVHSYQDCGLVLESDFSNTELEEIEANGDRLDYYDYVTSLSTKDYNSMIKPYSICDISYYMGLSQESQRKVIKAFIKNYGGLFAGLEGSPRIGGSVGCFYVDTNANDPETIYTFYSDNRAKFQYLPSYYPLTAYHAVTVVGWDDNITFGSETGAFLVMNSWGFEEANSYSFFYVPYSYDYIYDTFAGFICDESVEQNVKISDAASSSFTTEILTGSSELKNYFCYDDEISVSFKLKVDVFKDTEVKINSGSRQASDLFNISFSDEDKLATISIRQNLDVFYGGYYTINFYNDGNIIGKKSIYIFSGTELGNFKFLYEASSSWEIDSYALNNAFLNNDSTATINVSGIRQYYIMSFNMATPVYNAIVTTGKTSEAYQHLISISDVSIISSGNPTLETMYSSDELVAELGESDASCANALFYRNTISPSANTYKIQIGYGMTLDEIRNAMVRFKVTITSMIYENCARNFYFNMFVSERPYADSGDLNTITYVLDGGENDLRNINKYPKYTDIDVPDANMTTIKLLSPTKSGYRFVGWYASEDFSGSEITVIDSSFEGNIKLYAKWDRNLVEYFYVEIEKESLKDYNNNIKSITESVVYGDTIGIKFTLIENPETTVGSYNYQVSYYFYGPLLVSGSLASGVRSQVIDVGFPELVSGVHNFKLKIVVYITQNLTFETEKTFTLEVEKKNLSFAFSDLSKVYNGNIQKPSVSLVEDFYDEDKQGLRQEDLFSLTSLVTSRNFGNYTYFISEVFNKNYTFDPEQARCLFSIEKKEINLRWKDYYQVYDGLNHFPDYEVYGVISGDYVSFGFTQDECKAAGEYTINIDPNTISNPNYKVSSVNDFIFVIQKAKIKVILQNESDRIQTKIGRRAEPKYTIIGNYLNTADLQIKIISEGKHATTSGKYNISCVIGNSSYDAEIQDATYTLTGFYYVYYQLSNGEIYSEKVEEGQTPKGVTKEDLNAPMFSKIEYSDDYTVTGNDLFIAVTIKDYSGVVYSLVFVGGFLVLCVIYYFKKRESKVR